MAFHANLHTFKSVFAFVARWSTLMLAGCIGYVLVKCLSGFLTLGLPIYDWQWYAAISLFIVGLLLHLGLALPHTRRTRALYLLLLAWMLAGYNGFGFSERLSVAQKPPIAISFWAYTDFRTMPEPVLRDLAEIDATLYLHSAMASFDGPGDENLAEGLRRLAGYNIPVVLAVIPSDFLSAPTHEEWIAQVKLTAEFIRREQLSNVSALLGDVESPLKATPVPYDVSRQEIRETTAAFADLIRHVHARHPGLELGVTAMWELYLDGLDGDQDLAIASRSTVDPPGGWDIINVMTYSSSVPESLRAYWVYSVETAARRRYPTHDVSHLIGIVGGGFPWETPVGFEQLVRDARISRAVGVKEVVVFQLNGALDVFGEDFIAKLYSSVNGPQPDETISVPFSRVASLWHYSWLLLDATSSVPLSGVVALAVWAVLSGALVYRRRRGYNALRQEVPIIRR